MVVIEKMEVELGVLEKDAIDTLKKAEEQLKETKKAQDNFSISSSVALGIYTTKVIDAFSNLLFWVAKTSPVLEFHMANIGFAFENIAFSLGDKLAPAFEWAENAAWDLSDTFEDVMGVWDAVSTGAEDLGDTIRDSTDTSIDKLTELGTSISNITRDLLNIPESTDTTVNIKYLKTFDETLTSELENIPEDATAPEIANVLITSPVASAGNVLTEIGKDVGEGIFNIIKATLGIQPAGLNTHQATRQRQIELGIIKPRQDYSELYNKGFISGGVFNKLKEADMV